MPSKILFGKKDGIWQMWTLFRTAAVAVIQASQRTNFMDYRRPVGLPDSGCKTATWTCTLEAQSRIHPQAGLPVLINPCCCHWELRESGGFMGSWGEEKTPKWDYKIANPDEKSNCECFPPSLTRGQSMSACQSWRGSADPPSDGHLFLPAAGAKQKSLSGKSVSLRPSSLKELNLRQKGGRFSPFGLSCIQHSTASQDQPSHSASVTSLCELLSESCFSFLVGWVYKMYLLYLCCVAVPWLS